MAGSKLHFSLYCFQLKTDEGQVVEKKKRKKRVPKEVMMADDDDSDEDCAALKCLKPTGRQSSGITS